MAQQAGSLTGGRGGRMIGIVMMARQAVNPSMRLVVEIERKQGAMFDELAVTIIKCASECDDQQRRQ